MGTEDGGGVDSPIAWMLLPLHAVAAPSPVVWSDVGGFCPCQGHGTIEVGGAVHHVYFRSRHGDWSLDIGPECPEIPGYVDADAALWSWSGTDDADGWMEPEQARAIVAACLAMPTWPRGVVAERGALGGEA